MASHFNCLLISHLAILVTGIFVTGSIGLTHRLPSLIAKLLLLVGSSYLTACGGGADSTPDSPAIIPVATEQAAPDSCSVDLAYYQPSDSKPSISVTGDTVVELAVGDAYAELGATATDPSDGDVSAFIGVVGDSRIDSSKVQDHLVRYNVSNSQGEAALSAYRLVRVRGQQTALFTRRLFNEIDAPWEYFERLPSRLGQDPTERFPMLIVNHGWSNSKRFDTPGSGMQVMNEHSLLQYIQSHDFDHDLPFIILMPQRCWSQFADAEVQILNSFVQWAKRVYPVDENKIYMTGLSMGGWATWEYIRSYPNELAAAAPMAGGGDVGRICTAVPTPVWAFAAVDDPTVPYTQVRDTVEALAACPGSFKALPKLTLFPEGGHIIDDDVFNQNFLGQGDPSNDPFDQSLFDWFLMFDKAN